MLQFSGEGQKEQRGYHLRKMDKDYQAQSSRGVGLKKYPSLRESSGSQELMEVNKVSKPMAASDKNHC
jgi:hypothetical protein